jgi:hypothetical protein
MVNVTFWGTVHCCNGAHVHHETPRTLYGNIVQLQLQDWMLDSRMYGVEVTIAASISRYARSCLLFVLFRRLSLVIPSKSAYFVINTQARARAAL